MIQKVFDKNVSGGTVKKEIISNKELAEELHKPIIRTFDKRIVSSPYIDNIWGTDLADMQLIRKFNKEFRFLLRVIEIYNKYAQLAPLEGKNGIKITVFQKILDELIANQTEYGQIKTVNFTIDQ